jgi:hypothetical protein
LVTVTVAVPAVAIRDPETVAVSKPESKNVVGSGDPFQLARAPDWKLEPEIVSVKPGLPAMAVSGKMTEMLAPRIVVTSLTWSLPVLFWPPPDTVATLVTLSGALFATSTVSVIAG